MGVRYFERRLKGEPMIKTVTHPGAETIGLEIHVSLNDYEHNRHEEHVFYSQKDYRKFVRSTVAIGTCTGREWFITSTTVVLKESHDYVFESDENAD